MSVRRFAKEYGFTYSLWSDYENDRRRPNAETTGKLCRIFHVSADWLLFGEAQDLKGLAAELGHATVDKTIGGPKSDGEREGQAGTPRRVPTRRASRH